MTRATGDGFRELLQNKKLDRDQVDEALHQVFEGEEQMLPTIFDELKAEGELKGRVEGRVEGRMEGEVTGRVKDILHILQLRFQQPSASLSKKLSKITDLERLTILFERAMFCESIKAFSDSLK